ncbi:MarR family transcriptional regulator [Lactiplantibacillus garii]|uniref:MarR family transcriptional regulator n=1 Tax=Lactiplantibacillus garii TaxID=2306423 RepID=A0A3R8KHK9_9LACO|nr:MarR family winged helix-turn-helix transcriptional regulator [Lactiplantibacillus garii]RRK09987.1 MarR family transcriptional regulator [Lactiplantibacillus garii]
MQQPINYVLDIMHLERDLKRLTGKWSKTTGLKLNELRILVYVQQHPGMQIGEVASALTVAKASLAQSIGSLIDQGWLASEPTQHDRRLRVLTLTAKGRELMETVDNQLEASLSTSPALAFVDRLKALQA